MKRALARRLAAIEGFEDPDVDLEQYATPPALAANVVHLAALHDDLDRPVIDLGTGTGMLALAAAYRDPPAVTGLDVDRSALEIAQANESTIDPGVSVEWIQGHVPRHPLDLEESTVITNPPFGAQDGARGADRDFLDVARELSVVSYSIHNAGSQTFVESYAADQDGEVTHAFAAEFPVDAQFEFHTQDRAVIDVEVYRIEWPQS